MRVLNRRFDFWAVNRWTNFGSMSWISGKYCYSLSNINIFIPKMSTDRDRIRSLVTSHVGVMLGRSSISHCLCQCFFHFPLFMTPTCDVTEAIWQRGEGNKICVKVFSLAVIKNLTAPWDSAHQDEPSWVIKTQSNFSFHGHFKRPIFTSDFFCNLFPFHACEWMDWPTNVLDHLCKAT